LRISIEVDEFNYLVVSGNYKENVDFDPGSGTDWHTATGQSDGFVSKFDSDGTFIWASTWGGPGLENDDLCRLTLDGSNNSYVLGHFEYAVDFDPGPEVDEHTSNGESDVSLCKFLPDGYW